MKEEVMEENERLFRLLEWPDQRGPRPTPTTQPEKADEQPEEKE